METREREQLRVDTGETLRNPLLAFIGRPQRSVSVLLSPAVSSTILEAQILAH
jgi:hypothetical protein